MNKFIVRQELMNDSEIHEGILVHARENDITIQDATELVEEYIDEIIPFFNLLSYYKFGYRIADFLLNMIYEVVIDHENSKKLKKIPSYKICGKRLFDKQEIIDWIESQKEDPKD